MKICQYAFGGHSKDGEAGASGEGDPQTNAFTGEGIKPWALKVRVGLNCAALLKIQQHLFFPLNVPDASDWTRYMLGGRDTFSLKLFASNISCFYWGANIRIKLENLPDSVAALYGGLEGHWSHGGSSQALKVQVSHNRTPRNQQIWDSVKSRQRGQRSIHFAGYWILFPRYTSQHRDQINTSCASALPPISHFFPPRWRTLLQCNVVGKIEWTTFPGRLIISWILSACSLWWGLTEGLTGENDVLFSAGITVQVPLRQLQLRYEVYINHRFSGPSRVHGGREDSQSKGKWVAQRGGWGCRETLEDHACMRALRHSTGTYK